MKIFDKYMEHQKIHAIMVVDETVLKHFAVLYHRATSKVESYVSIDKEMHEKGWCLWKIIT